MSAWDAAVDELVYRSYAHNRRLAPRIGPMRWACVYGDAAWEMERRYQAEVGVPVEDTPGSITSGDAK